MSGSDRICNNVTYLAKKRKAITEMNTLKNKLLEQQCMSIGEVTRQYLVEKGLYGNPVQSKTYWEDAIQRAGQNRSWFATILDCYTELFDLVIAAKRSAMNASSGNLLAETRSRYNAEFQGIVRDIKALLLRRVFEERVTLQGNCPDVALDYNLNPGPAPVDCEEASSYTTMTPSHEATEFPPVEIQVGYNTYSPVSVNFQITRLDGLHVAYDGYDLTNDAKATEALSTMDADIQTINDARDHVMSIDRTVASWVDVARNFIVKFDADIEKWKQDSINATSERLSALSDQLELLKIYMGEDRL
jgi:hypothetical protein